MDSEIKSSARALKREKMDPSRLSTAAPVPPLSIPLPLAAGLALAAGFMVFTAWDQSYWWRTKEDYSFGWLVPLFVAYVLFDRWPKVRAWIRSAANRPGGTGRGFARHLDGPNWIAILALVPAGALFLFGAFYRAAAGTTHLSTLCISVGMAGIVLGALFIFMPAGALSERWKLLQLFLFPVLVWLISAPLLTSVESDLNLFLMRQVTSTVFFVFDLLGLPLQQQGNVLMLPSGSVGVAEACSGIRSLTGCLFAGTFLAAVFVDAWWKKAVLMVAALLFAVVSNLLRSVFLTSWAYRFGAGSIEGAVHDVSAYAILALTAVALIVLLRLVNSRWFSGTTDLGDGQSLAAG